MGKSFKVENYIKRVEVRSNLYHRGLTVPQMARRLRTNEHNVRIFISRFRGYFPELVNEVFPYRFPNNWLIGKK